MKKLLYRTEYEEMMKKTSKEGECQLCDLGKQIILSSSEYWLWTACLSPYWRYHTMFVTKKHAEDITELSIEQFVDLQNFYFRVKSHLLSLKLKQADGKPMDQF